MCISMNENYSHWVHKIFELVQNFRTGLPRLHAREELCSNWLSLSLSLLEWPGMTRNDHPYKLEWSIRPHSAVETGELYNTYIVRGHPKISTFSWVYKHYTFTRDTLPPPLQVYRATCLGSKIWVSRSIIIIV